MLEENRVLMCSLGAVKGCISGEYLCGIDITVLH